VTDDRASFPAASSSCAHPLTHDSSAFVRMIAGHRNRAGAPPATAMRRGLARYGVCGL